ncbi:MAG: hypothetical protein WA822_03495 [Albidovulum sp.]
MQDDDSRVVAVIAPSMPRRIFAAGVLGLLGVILELLAFLRPPASAPLQLLLICLGVVALAVCARIWRASGQGLVLTPTALRDSDGRLVADVALIAQVERGIFAFKPSNGFLLTMQKKQPRAWAPGLWWRFGRRVGVGGAISGAEGRAMADAISALIAQSRSASSSD